MKAKILVVCGSGVATSMHVAYKLREQLRVAKVNATIDGAGNNELPYRIKNYDIILSNNQVTVKTDKPVLSAIPLLTGVGEKAQVEKIIELVREINAKNING